MSGESDPARPAGGALALLVALGVAMVLGFVGASAVSMERSLGWDESMHAALPAARMSVALEFDQGREALDVALDCQQYPPFYPSILAAFGGSDEAAMRAAGRWSWALGLFGLFGLVRAAGRRDGLRASSANWAAPLAFVFGLTSPLALAYSGTLFLEVPFLTVSILAMWAWIARADAANVRSQWIADLVAGTLITVAFFTKFNYGLLLGAGLFLDLVCQGVGLVRAGNAARFARRTAVLAAPFTLACAWWFVLPWPAGSDVAASHREAFLGFLTGNTQLGTTPYWRRAWDFASFFAPSPRLALVLVGGVLLALRHVARPGTRALAFVALTSVGAIATHNFHLDRFLLGVAAPLWALAALGVARRLPARASAAGGVLAVGLTLALVFPTVDSRWLVDGLGVRTSDNADYVDGLQRERLDLTPGRDLPTAGLVRSEHDALLDRIAGAVGPEARIAWIGINSELSPAALHLGLLQRGGSPERFRRDAGQVRPDGEPAMVVTFQGIDPGWTPEVLRGWASGFDVVLSTTPVDWKQRSGREFIDGYRGWLFETGEWNYESIGSVPISRAAGDATEVEVFVCRPSGN